MEKPSSHRRGLEIRAASGADASAVSALLGDHGVTWPQMALADRLDTIRNGAGTVLVALDWGPPVGIVALHWFAGLQAARPVAQIDLLLVGEENRRKGIARLLVKAAAQAARVAGCGALHVVAHADNVPLRAFCIATGFSEAGLLFGRPLRKAAG